MDPAVHIILDRLSEVERRNRELRDVVAQHQTTIQQQSQSFTLLQDSTMLPAQVGQMRQNLPTAISASVTAAVKRTRDVKCRQQRIRKAEYIFQ